MSKRVYIAIDGDDARALRRLEQWFAHFYHDASLARRVAIWGPPHRCLAALDDVRRHGARLVILNPVFDEREQIDRLLADVVPSQGTPLPHA